MTTGNTDHIRPQDSDRSIAVSGLEDGCVDIAALDGESGSENLQESLSEVGSDEEGDIDQSP